MATPRMEASVWLWFTLGAVAAPPSDPPADTPDAPEETEEIDVQRGGTRTKDAKDWGFDTESDADDFDIEDDDPGMVDFVAAKRRKPAAPTSSHLFPAGKQALQDDWDLHFVAFNEHLVILELPVLVATDRASFEAAYPHGLLLVGEWASGGQDLVVRQEIHAADLFASAPSFAFLKAAFPNPKPVDHVRVVVKTAALPAPPELPEATKGKRPAPVAPPPPVLPKVRYARTTVYSRS